MQKITLVTLAAGNGTRMKSKTPKPLHKIAGKTMLEHSFNCVSSLSIAKKIIVASEDLVENSGDILDNFTVVIQQEKLGTGHAVMQCLSEILSDSIVVISYGDTPFVRPETIENMVEKARNGWDIVVLGSTVSDVSQKYGRLVMNGENLLEIIEYKDADEKTRASAFCNSGMIVAKSDVLISALERVVPKNVSKEYYLTDIVKIAVNMGKKATCSVCEEGEVMGVNSRIDLAAAEKYYQKILRKKHMENGVTMLNPKTVYFSWDTILENDITLEGNIHFGTGVFVKNGSIIKAFSHLERCEVGADCVVGPFARIRPNSRLENSVHIGNFVEIKASNLESGVKIGHLSYIGDASVGENTNIGAGTITCNYDGFEKHKTTIGAGVFVGSNTCFIAPIEVKNNVITAAGSVISKDVPENSIAIARAEQKNIENGAQRFRSRRKK